MSSVTLCTGKTTDKKTQKQQNKNLSTVMRPVIQTWISGMIQIAHNGSPQRQLTDRLNVLAMYLKLCQNEMPYKH